MVRVLAAICCLVLAGCHRSSGRGDALPASWHCWPDRVEGLGTDRHKARENAWKVARERILECLHRQVPPLEAWVPSETYIRKNLLNKEGPGEDLPLEGITAKQWILHLKVPNVDRLYRLDEEAARAIAARERLVISGRVFVCVAALLAGVVTNIRLNERMRNRYARRVTLSSALVVLAVWAAMALL